MLDPEPDFNIMTCAPGSNIRTKTLIVNATLENCTRPKVNLLRNIMSQEIYDQPRLRLIFIFKLGKFT